LQDLNLISDIGNAYMESFTELSQYMDKNSFFKLISTASPADGCSF